MGLTQEEERFFKEKAIRYHGQIDWVKEKS